jgi:hypothetical protein
MIALEQSGYGKMAVTGLFAAAEKTTIQQTRKLRRAGHGGLA